METQREQMLNARRRATQQRRAARALEDALAELELRKATRDRAWRRYDRYMAFLASPVGGLLANHGPSWLGHWLACELVDRLMNRALHAERKVRRQDDRASRALARSLGVAEDNVVPLKAAS